MALSKREQQRLHKDILLGYLTLVVGNAQAMIDRIRPAAADAVESIAQDNLGTYIRALEAIAGPDLYRDTIAAVKQEIESGAPRTAGLTMPAQAGDPISILTLDRNKLATDLRTSTNSFSLSHLTAHLKFSAYFLDRLIENALSIEAVRNLGPSLSHIEILSSIMSTRLRLDGMPSSEAIAKITALTGEDTAQLTDTLTHGCQALEQSYCLLSHVVAHPELAEAAEARAIRRYRR